MGLFRETWKVQLSLRYTYKLPVDVHKSEDRKTSSKNTLQEILIFRLNSWSILRKKGIEIGVPLAMKVCDSPWLLALFSFVDAVPKNYEADWQENEGAN